MSNAKRFYPSWTLSAELVVRARESVREGEALRSITGGGFREHWIAAEGFGSARFTPGIMWGFPLGPAQVVAVADGLAEPVGSGEQYRVTPKGMAELKAAKMPVPMFVKGCCGWQGREDGYTVFQTIQRKEEPMLLIPSPLHAAPWDRSGGIFSNDGAVLSRENVALLRDQLTQWLEEHAAETPARDEMPA